MMKVQNVKYNNRVDIVVRVVRIVFFYNFIVMLQKIKLILVYLK